MARLCPISVQRATCVPVTYGLIVRMTRRYEVRLGLPESSTARITCAVPGMRGTTVAFALVEFSTTTRAGGWRGPPEGADGMLPAPASPPPPTGGSPRVTTGRLGTPVPASG